MSLNRKFRMIAKALPPAIARDENGKPRTYLARVSGKTILESDAKATDSKGKKIDPKGVYGQLKVIYTNHFNNIKSAYDKGGQKAVEDYVAKHKQVTNSTK
jgi:hypothetical protein